MDNNKSKFIQKHIEACTNDKIMKYGNEQKIFQNKEQESHNCAQSSLEKEPKTE